MKICETRTRTQRKSGNLWNENKKNPSEPSGSLLKIWMGGAREWTQQKSVNRMRLWVESETSDIGMGRAREWTEWDCGWELQLKLENEIGGMLRLSYRWKRLRFQFRGAKWDRGWEGWIFRFQVGGKWIKFGFRVLELWEGEWKWKSGSDK